MTAYPASHDAELARVMQAVDLIALTAWGIITFALALRWFRWISS